MSERRIITVAAGIVVLVLVLFTAAMALSVPVWLVGPAVAWLAWWLAAWPARDAERQGVLPGAE